MQKHVLSNTIILFSAMIIFLAPCVGSSEEMIRDNNPQHAYNGEYTGPNLNRIAFPIGAMGAGMFCLEGTGAISHMSVRNKPDLFFTPHTYAALCVLGESNVAKVLEGPVPTWRIFGSAGTGNGASGSNFGMLAIANVLMLLVAFIALPRYDPR
jgi:hypothetical protein